MSKNKSVIIVPVGSYEQHGPLLPNNTDSIIADYIATQITAKLPDSIKMPVLNYGRSPEHKGFKYLASVNSLNYYNFLFDMLSSLIDSSDASLIVLVNGHGGNLDVLHLLANDLNYEYVTKTIVIHPYTHSFEDKAIELFGHTDTHAGSIEASFVNFIDRKSVKEEIYNPLFKKKINSGLKLFKTKDLSICGAINDSETIVINTDFAKELLNFITDEAIVTIQKTLNKINTIHATKTKN